MTVRGPDWWREAYDLSPAPKALFTVYGGEHSLGGIPNYEARETTDESPARIAAEGDLAWSHAVAVERRTDVAGGPLQEPHAQSRFKLLDGFGRGRARQAEIGRRRAEALPLDHADEQAHRVEPVHAGSPTPNILGKPGRIIG